MSEHSIQRANKVRLAIMFVLTFSYMVAELVVGYIGKSTSLIADAFHMLSDVIALTIAFLAIMLSPKKWKKGTFGWARAEVLGALINAVFLVALCFSIVVESVKRLFAPEPITEPIWVFAVGLGGLIINLIGLFIFSGKESGDGEVRGERRGSLIQNQGRLTRMVGAGEIMDDDDSTSTTAIVEIPDATKENSLVSASSKAVDSSTTPSVAVEIEASLQPSPSLKRPSQPLQQPPSSLQQQPPSSTPRPEHKVVFATESPPQSASQGHRHSHSGGDSKMNLHGVFLHLLADALGSIIVVISASISWAKHGEPRLGWVAYIEYIDPTLSLIVVLMIICSTWPLLQEASLVLLQTVPDNIQVEDLKRQILEDIPGVYAIHEFHVWQLAGDRIVASIHLVCNDITDYVRISRQVKELFHRAGIHSTTVQAEFATSSQSNIGDKECLVHCPTPSPGSPGAGCTDNTCCGPQKK